MGLSVGFLGFGHAVPPHVRTNEDPIFARIRAAAPHGDAPDADLFPGVKERRYLKPGETIEDLMVLAGQRAMSAAALTPSNIDRLYGYSSVSEYLVPNGLFKVHQGMGLPSRTMVVPIDAAFTNFITGAALAWEAIMAGRCRHVMIACGSGWTRNADYDADYAVVLGDGAGVAVVGPSERFVIVDHLEESFTDDDSYRGMNLKIRAAALSGAQCAQVDDVPTPTFEINEGGVRALLAQGLEAPPRLVRNLLEKHALTPDHIALVGHQGSRKLMDYWAQAIRPKQYLHTVEQYGDLTMASIPVTLAALAREITAEYLVLLAPGPGVHFAALLVRR